jgi:uncharacterized protein (TIGR02147 family)
MSTDDFYRSCIQSELDRRIQKNHSYSLRAFARALRLEPGALSQFLSGKRIPSLKASQKILQALDLSVEDRKAFLSSLVKRHQARGLKRLSPALRSIEIEEPRKVISADAFRIIGDWYHYALLLLAETEGFKADNRWVASRLGISQMEAKFAFDRLQDLKLLQKVDGKWRFVDQDITTEDKSLTTPALKRRQKQVLEKAIEALENDPIETRSMTGMTMAIDPEKIPEAKKLISEFNRKMSKFLETGKKSEVYELQISLFSLQKRGNL